MALTTLEAYKTFFGVTGNEKDAEIEAAVDIADAIIVNFCGRSLESTEYTHYYDGGQSELILEFGPVISVASVTEDGTATTDYTLYEEDARIVKGSQARSSYISYAKFNGGLKGVKVVYTAGHATIPVDLAYAAMLVTKKIYTDKNKKITAAAGSPVKRQRLHGEERDGQIRNTIPDMAYIASQASVLPAEVIAILRTYCY